MYQQIISQPCYNYNGSNTDSEVNVSFKLQLCVTLYKVSASNRKRAAELP